MKEKTILQAFPEGFAKPHALSEMAKNSAILVGFSGGADSRALLDLLMKYAKESCATIYAAHVNHGIRGDEADRDEEFCRKVATEYGIQFFSCKLDIPSLAKRSGKSIELAARDERYAFFAKIMRENSIPLLATAHNANDNLETMLFNLARGSGLAGLCGIPQTRSCEGGLLIRPILLMTKDEVLSYCEENALEFVTDSTNTDTDYTRNKIRAEIVPVLREIVSSPEKKAADASALLREDNALLSSMADDLIDDTESGVLPLDTINSAPRPIASRAVIKLFSRVCDASLEAVHVNDVLELCRSKKQGARISLPAGLCARINGSRLEFVHTASLDAPEAEEFIVSASDGETFISQINAEIVIGKSQRDINIYKKSIKFYIDCAKINRMFTLRQRRAGDKIFMGGMHKSVKKLMCDKKIPSELRSRIPMICDGDRIVAIPFIGVCDDAKPKKDATNNLLIQFYLY